MKKRKAKVISWADYFRETNQYPMVLRRKDEEKIFMQYLELRKKIDEFVDEIYEKYEGNIPLQGGKKSLLEYIISIESDGYIENNEVVAVLNYSLPRFVVKNDFYKYKGIDSGMRLATYCAFERIATKTPLPYYEKALVTLYAGVKTKMQTDVDNRLFIPIINGIKDTGMIKDDNSEHIIFNFRVVPMEKPVTVITIKDAENLLQEEYDFARKVADKSSKNELFKYE